MKRLTTNDQRLTVIILTVAVLLISGCRPRAEKTSGDDTIPVRASRVELRQLEDTIDYVGNIKARDEVMVYPRVSGKISEKVKQDGNPVNKGDVIAYIDRDEVGLKYEKAPVESPLTGIVGRVYVDIGENVAAQTPIALVVDIDKIKINLDVPERYLPKVSLGLEAKISVDAYPGEEFLGRVVKVSPVVDLDTRAAPVQIVVDNPGQRLKPGMFAKASLIIEKQPLALVILKEAIMGREPDNYVYLVQDNKAVMRKITLGLHSGPYYQVREGVKEGDLVVIVGQQRLYDNAPVVAETGNGNGDIK